MKNYVSSIAHIYECVLASLNADLKVVISVPPSKSLEEVPIISWLFAPARSYYLIKHFASMDFKEDQLYVIYIINSMPSAEDPEIIDNFKKIYDDLKYTIEYKVNHIQKKNFHIYV